MVAPPLDVGLIAEGTNHYDARPLLWIRFLVRNDGHGHAKERRNGVLADVIRVSIILGMDDYADAGREKLRARCGHGKLHVRAFDAEIDVVIRAR